jgi:hypothetical protein
MDFGGAACGKTVDNIGGLTDQCGSYHLVRSIIHSEPSVKASGLMMWRTAACAKAWQGRPAKPLAFSGKSMKIKIKL